MKRLIVFLFLLISFCFPNGIDSLKISIAGIESPTAIWWPQNKANKTAKVIVWFHGGMTSNNCEKGLIAGKDFSKIYSNSIVVSVSACREHHWLTIPMINVIDVALDSIAVKRKNQVDKISLVGVSDGSLGVIAYSNAGKRFVEERLLMSSYGSLLGDAITIASEKKMNNGKWTFFQGGEDRLYRAEETLPWINDFCKTIGKKCIIKFDPKGQHDWSYWNQKHLDWVREAILP